MARRMRAPGWGDGLTEGEGSEADAWPQLQRGYPTSPHHGVLMASQGSDGLR